jgi:hypothetical protein
MTTTSTAPDLATARLLANAVNEAYLHYQNPAHKISVPGYTVAGSFFVYETGEAEFFGFTAKQNAQPYSQMVICRGTDNDYEAIYDISWSPVPCKLPPHSGKIGLISDGLESFYLKQYLWETSLRESLAEALKGFEGGRTVYVAGHSLGGGVSTLAALDILLNGMGLNGGESPAWVEHYTFGSIHVGQSDFAGAFNSAIAPKGVSYRVVNLADFAPALTGVSADTPGYVHVGTPWSYLWQTEGDWGNHSLVNNYIRTLASFPQVLKPGNRVYPQ